MKKMKSKKSRPRLWDSFFGPKNSSSNWVQENLQEMNQNFRRMLKLIEDSDADSFAEKVEMYYQRRQQLINLVEKGYRIHLSLAERYNHHATGEVGKSLSKFPSSKQLNVHSKGELENRQSQERAVSDVGSNKLSNIVVPFSSGSKQLRRPVSVKRSNYLSKIEISKNPAPTVYYSMMTSSCRKSESESESEDRSISNYSGTQSDDDDGEELQHEGTDDELEAELRDMIEKLYIQLEGDRVVPKLQGGILRYEDNACVDDGEFREVKESVSCIVDKALLEENLELNVHSKGGLQNLQSQERVISDVGSNKPTNKPFMFPLRTLRMRKLTKHIVSVVQTNYHKRGKTITRPAATPAVPEIYRFGLVSESEDSSIANHSDTQSDGEQLQHKGTDDELEADLRDMIQKLYIEQEEDRVVSKLQGGILRYEDNTCDHDGEFREAKESISSNVDKALLEENLELQGEIARLLKEISYLEEYNEETYERCQSLEAALRQATAERIEAETTLRASEVEQLKAIIVKKNNNVDELNRILEAVVAERDQLKARVAMLDADPRL